LFFSSESWWLKEREKRSARRTVWTDSVLQRASNLPIEIQRAEQ